MKTERLPNGNLLVHAPLQLRRVSNRRLILAPEAAAEPAHDLLVRIARAHRWLLDLENGRYESPTALAASLGMDRSNFMRELTLSDLAPDVVRALLAGDLPPDLAIARLQKIAAAPWATQKKALGLP